jgi:hypothetical protein
MPDYSNLAMVKDGIITRDPVLSNLYGLTVEQLGDESIMTQFDFIAEGRRWYPIVDTSPALQRYQSYDGDAVLTFDPAALVVRSVRIVRDWTAAEILAFKQNSTRHISRRAFRFRFTVDERIAFEMAQVDDPTAAQAARLVAAGLRVMDKDIAASAYINLNDSATQAGVQQLEALGVIAAARAEAIIWGDIEPGELP